jgi:RNA polymerase sigma-70 factor (ECF subfamily)
MRRLRQAILSLPKLQRDIFVACRVHGLSYDEIASHAGLSRREVERQLAKAICTVARRMNEKPRWWRHLF